MNVGIFTDNDFAKVNGVTTSLKAVVRYAPQDIKPRIYTASDYPEERPDYFAASGWGMGMPFYKDMHLHLPWLGTLLRQVREDRIDLLHLTTPGPLGLAALFVAWRTGLRIVGSFHTDLAAYAARLSGSARLGVLMREYLRWPYGRCERVFVPSESTRQLLIDGHIDRSKIRLWTRGVDTQLFSPTKRSSILRQRWRVCDRRPAVIYVGRLSREKGLSMLPAIVSAMHRHGVEHRLVLVGDGPMRRELQELLPDAIFTGTLAPLEVATALASSDVFLFPSDTDSAGNVVLEAQACGVPPLVSTSGGPKEYIRPYLTGMVCEAGDAHAFGRVAAQLLRDPVRRLAMGQAARRHAETLKWESALAPLYQAYTEVGAHGEPANRHIPGTSAPAAAGGAAA